MNRIVPALSALALGALLLPSLAFAQAVGGNFITTTSPTTATSVSPGSTGTSFGTVTLTGTQQQPVQISSIPLTVTGGNGGVPSNLSNCSLYDSNGNALQSGNNTVNAVSASGATTFTLNQPLTINYNSPTTLTVRCNVSSSAASGSNFQVVAGAPSLAPSLGATITPMPSVQAGTFGAPIATISLNPSASGSNVNVSSIPLSASFNNGLSNSNLSNCRLTNGSTNVTSGTTLNGGSNSLALNSALSLTGGNGPTTLTLLCDVSSLAPVGSSLALTLAPSSITATDPATNNAITPAGGFSNGIPAPLTGTTLIAAAAGTGTTGGGTVIAPPNTGSGAAAKTNLIALALLALAALGAGAYLFGRKPARG